ncbi:hypothetical protein B0H16DRAFT_1858927 [Mycena metata]|uniref:Uncharacterized protein n=1 Tax=Mycena metata TaxID=1033252 RepID=A0AAD7K3T7_9AGAR|nr:hypothetical protein B0H16DRAFT_1858927 [Mycena metata]
MDLLPLEGGGGIISAAVELIQQNSLHRATLPLKLTLRNQGIRTQPLPARIHNLLLEHAGRWEQLDLCLPHADLVRLFERFAGSFPLLRSLVISMPYYSGTPSLSFGPLRNSVLLRTLDIGRHCPQPSLSGIPWTHLTSPFSGYCKRGVASFSVVTEVLHTPSTPYIPLHLPELRVLSIMSSDDFRALTYLTLPGLERLAGPDIDNTTTREIPDLLSRSHCYLTHLSTHAKHLDEAHFPDLFTALPHLVELVLNIGLASSIPVVSLLHGENQNLPKLTGLSLFAGGLVPIDYKILVKMLESRTGRNLDGVAQLQIFEYGVLGMYHLPFDASIPPAIVERVGAMVDMGMDITLEGQRFRPENFELRSSSWIRPVVRVQ